MSRLATIWISVSIAVNPSNETRSPIELFSKTIRRRRKRAKALERGRTTGKKEEEKKGNKIAITWEREV